MSDFDNFLEMLANNQSAKYDFGNIEYETSATYLEGLDVPANEVKITSGEVAFIFTVDGQFIGMCNYK